MTAPIPLCNILKYTNAQITNMWLSPPLRKNRRREWDYMFLLLQGLQFCKLSHCCPQVFYCSSVIISTKWKWSTPFAWLQYGYFITDTKVEYLKQHIFRKSITTHNSVTLILVLFHSHITSCKTTISNSTELKKLRNWRGMKLMIRFKERSKLFQCNYGNRRVRTHAREHIHTQRSLTS